MEYISKYNECRAIGECEERYDGVMDFLGTLSPASSGVDSQESSNTFTSPVSIYGVSSPNPQKTVIFDLDSMMQPKLLIKEQPVDKFRFRYKSEMMGAHGSLNGRSSDRSRKVSYPKVELINYEHNAIIRCTLYSVNNGERMMHPHRLVSGDSDDPHDREVGPDGYEVEFSNMGIIHTARKFVTEELVKKKTRVLCDLKNRPLTAEEKSLIKIEAARDTKNMNLNTVCLCFEAFHKTPAGELKPICEKVFSDQINNRKSAMTGELKICRIDKTVGDCTGGDEVFILVEKVVKKNIKVIFFELRNDDLFWREEARFNELDVHHQYAIVFKTPPYKDTNITKPVRVFIELFRPSDGENSDSIEFTYKPVKKTSFKRPRYDSDDLPTTLDSINVSDHSEIECGSQARQVLSDSADQIDSEEFHRKIFYNPEFMEKYSNTFEDDLKMGMLTCDGPKTPTCLKTTHSNIDSIQEQETGSILAEKVVNLIKSQMRVNPERIPNLLEKLFAKRTPEGNSALHTAIQYQQNQQIRFLILLLENKGTTDMINCVNNSNETALHCAVQNGFPIITELLLRIGADPNMKDCKGETPVHVAMQQNFPVDTVIKFLKVMTAGEMKLEIDVKNDAGYTPLHLAVKYGNLDAVKFLMQAGADPNNIISGDGSTSVHLAVKENQKDILMYLLGDERTEIDKTNYMGSTALQIARAEGNKELCHILEVHNANPNISTTFVSEIKSENTIDEDDDEDDPLMIKIESTDENISDIKCEPMPVDEHNENSNIHNESDFILFDEQCLDELSSIIDDTPLLMNLADKLKCRQCISVFKQDTSPIKILISFAQVNGMTVDNIRSSLESLDAFDAVNCIDRMKKRYSKIR